MAKISFAGAEVASSSRQLPYYDFGHAPSDMQIGFYQWIYNGDGSAVLIAVAGSGKSTAIVNSLMFIEPHKFVTILAFNSTIAEEMRQKIVELGRRTGRNFYRVQAKTFHSLGYGAVRKRLGNVIKGDKPDGGKLRELFKMKFGEEAYTMYGSFVTKLVGMAKGAGVGAIIKSVPSTWREIIKHHDLSLDSEEADEEQALEYCGWLLRYSNEEAEKGWIDYDDQIYLPILWRLKLWENDYVFIDEAQDTNVVRRILAEKALRSGGRLIAVGDPNQAIYGFTGASHDAIELIKNHFNAIELPLTVSYRCPKIAEKMVQPLVPHFSVWEGAKPGMCIRLDLKGALLRLKDTDAILCRNTAPLVELAFKIISQGRGCMVLGKDIGAGLIRLINLQKAQTIDTLEERLEAYRDREYEKLMEKGEEAKAESIRDRVGSILAVVKLLPENKRTVPQLITVLTNMFSDGDDGRQLLILSTAHKAKGREWPRVAHLEPGLIPSRWARLPHQFKQEMNLKYVVETRFQEEFIILQEGITSPVEVTFGPQ